MIQFDQDLTIGNIVLPTLSSGILSMGFLLFAYIYNRTRELTHLAMMLMALFGFGFVFGETLILVASQWMGDAGFGMNMHRWQQISGAFFTVSLPLLLYTMLELNKAWKNINKYVVYFGLFFSLFIIIISYVSPDLFISQTIHKAEWQTRAKMFAKGKEGIFYTIRDGYLAILILYSLICAVYEMIVNSKFKYLLSPLIGLLLAIYGALIDILNIYDIYPPDPTHEIDYSRFSAGITIFIIFLMASILRQFFDIAKEVVIAKKRADHESEKNYKQNIFIKDVLKNSSRELINSTEQLSSSISVFTENSQEQAAATEQVTASIEEVTAGIDNVKTSADQQYQSLETLTNTMETLSDIIADMGVLVVNAIQTVEEISNNAREGEQSLKVMNESMDKISASSAEITGIIQIINDISDRINLLSLNASIEAARAGEAGRGFAVVADEVSKLADQTASSIKNIDQLIHTNENEITNGVQNITNAVEKIDKIINDMEEFVDRIQDMSNNMKSQNTANETVNENAEKVKSISEQIMGAMGEQKSAINEISRSVNSINELSQSNTLKIFEITDSSKSLVGMVEDLNRKIDDYQNE